MHFYLSFFPSNDDYASFIFVYKFLNKSSGFMTLKNDFVFSFSTHITYLNKHFERLFKIIVKFIIYFQNGYATLKFDELKFR